MQTWAEVRRLLISFGTMLMGVRPGLTTDTFMNSPPRSTAMRGPAHAALICTKPKRVSLSSGPGSATRTKQYI